MKLEATESCVALIELLKSKHGDLMFHQSGGCCDGSSPMCYPLGEFKVGGQDVLVGKLAGCPFYMGKAQYKLCNIPTSRLTWLMDVVQVFHSKYLRANALLYAQKYAPLRIE